MPGKGTGSILRLVYGGVALGLEELFVRLRVWDDESPHQQLPKTQEDRNLLSVQPHDDQPVDQTTPSTIRHALFGLAVELQDRLRTTRRRYTRAERDLLQTTRTLTRPILSSRLLTPAQKQFTRFVARGQSEVDRLASIGKREEERSKSLARTAYQTGLDEVIGDLAENPEVQQLVQTQASGLVAEIVEEIRERSVSGDLLLEGITRYLLGKKPRAEMPPPPLEVQIHARSLKTSHEK